MSWVEAIQTVGISAVFVVIMAYFVKYMFDKFTAMIDTLNAQHKEEMTTVNDALLNNTVAIQELTDLLKSEKGGDTV